MYDIWRIIKLSPLIALRKAIDIYIAPKSNKIDMFNHSTYCDINLKQNNILLYHIFPVPEIEGLLPYQKIILEESQQICKHNFRLLSSEYKHVELQIINSPELKEYDSHTAARALVECVPNKENREHAQKFIPLLSPEYYLIDWQIDFNSGFAWDISLPSKNITYGHTIGADIKVPWELGRMQHLVNLAFAFAVSLNEKKSEEAAEVLKEYCNQIVDFYISNPPHLGTQWMTTMDVALRAVNLSVSYSFFLQYGANFSAEFKVLFNNLLSDHKHFIRNYLEWSSGMRGNHYLAGVSGLLILACYLPMSNENDEIIKFALSQILQDISYQFHTDGGNFEASTSYHRFAAEMVFYSLTAFFSLPKSRLRSLNNLDLKDIKLLPDFSISLNEGVVKSLAAMFHFLAAIAYPNGALPQIGDNDSGFFVAVSPYSTALSVGHSKNEPQNARRLLAFFSGYFHDIFGAENNIFYQSNKIEYETGKSLRNKSSIDFNPQPLMALNNYMLQSYIPNHINKFSDFGVYIVYKEKYQLIFKCGRIGQHGKGGHDHNDQLSFELSIKGSPVIIDAGTCCYTSNPALRTEVRSVT